MAKQVIWTKGEMRTRVAPICVMIEDERAMMMDVLMQTMAIAAPIAAPNQPRSRCTCTLCVWTSADWRMKNSYLEKNSAMNPEDPRARQVGMGMRFGLLYG